MLNLTCLMQGNNRGDSEDVWEVNLIDSLVQEHFEKECLEDPLARTLMFSKGLDCLDGEEVWDILCEDSVL